MKINRDDIVAAALLLLNERGLDGLTTRALADRLGVRQPALYWHFKDRRALLDAMNEVIEAGVAMPSADQPWQDYLFSSGQAFRAALMVYRDGARVHAGSRANRTQLERQMTVLTEAGLPVGLAIQVLVSIGRFVVGWVLEEQAEASALPGERPVPGSLAERAIHSFFAMGDEAAFEAGLRFLIGGAEHALPRRAPRRFSPASRAAGNGTMQGGARGPRQPVRS